MDVLVYKKGRDHSFPEIVTIRECVTFENGDAREIREAFPDFEVEVLTPAERRERISDFNFMNTVAAFAVMGMRSRDYDGVKELARALTN
jgi:hypothetical protein